MKAKTHTPGPWVIQPIESGSLQIPITEGQDGYTICSVRLDDSGIHFLDAKLIAAAPEMIDILEEVADIFSDLTEEDSLLQRQIYKKIIGTLAKARGGDQ